MGYIPNVFFVFFYLVHSLFKMDYIVRYIHRAKGVLCLLYQFIILTSIKKLQNDRSVNAVYYLLQGKQSIQTIQDAHLYDLSQYYRIYKRLSKEKYLQSIYNLKKDGFLYNDHDNNRMYITNKGIKWLKTHEDIALTWYGNGMLYHQIDDMFYKRLLLLIQVWTNAKKLERSYIPIVEEPEIRLWIKQFFQTTKSKIPEYLQTLYDELSNIFMKVMNPMYVEIFVLQLTSYKQIGLADVQLAKKYKLSIEDIELITINMTHHILETINKYPSKFQVLRQITKGITQTSQLTQSASKTKYFIEKGFTLEQVAHRRKLKINTIYDHIVEIAIAEQDFLWQNYVTKDVIDEIICALREVDSYSLKEIKRHVSESISYFQIRLVLAKYQAFAD